MIPKTIYICYKHVEQIQQTAQNWATLNPEYIIQLYNDELCEHFLLTECGEVYRDLFRYIPDGPIKADFWRICILYKYGGVYVDADIEPLVSLREFVEEDVDFLTCRSFNGEYNPHVIMVKPNDPMLEIGINRYITAFINNCKYNYWDWSIVALFCELFNNIGMPKLRDGVYMLHNRKYQVLQENNECKSENIDDVYKQKYSFYCEYKQVRVLNNRYKNYDYEKHEFCIPNINFISNIITNSNTILLTTTIPHCVLSQKRINNIINEFSEYNIPIIMNDYIKKQTNKNVISCEMIINSILLFKKTNIDYAIICDNDFFPIPNFMEELNKTVNVLPTNWRCLHLCPGYLWG